MDLGGFEVDPSRFGWIYVGGFGWISVDFGWILVELGGFW